MQFTIVTPVLNGLPWLPEAVGSVARQRDGADFELEHIVLDGGSTDGSREWLKSHEDLGYRLWLEPDDGQTAALRTGFDRASGELFGWLNSDDLLEPGALGTVHEIFVSEPDVVMVSGACLFIDGHGKVVGAMATPPVPTIDGLVKTRINPPQPATFFRATAYRAAGGLDTSFNLAMDVDLWLKLARQGRYVVLPDRVLARYRVHAQAKSERLAVASAREDLRARRRHGMPWRSQAGVELLRKAYLGPIFGRVPHSIARSIRGAVRRVVVGPRR
ncbi:MAG: glycosyltransferase family 2 protein [Candidatus Limnocylindrales bacterium]